MRKYNIPGYPTIVFLSSEGEFISMHGGYQDAELLAPVMKEISDDEANFIRSKVEIQKTPDDPKTNADLALIYAKRGKIEEGKPVIDKALKLDPQNKTGLLPELHTNLGLYYGQNAADENAAAYFQKAEHHFNTVIKKYPQSKSFELAQLYLGITYAIQEKYPEAIAILEKAIHAKEPLIQQRAVQFLEQVKSMADSSK